MEKQLLKDSLAQKEHQCELETQVSDMSPPRPSILVTEYGQLLIASGFLRCTGFLHHVRRHVIEKAFLACLYKCARRANTLPSVMELAFAVVLAKC